MLSSVEQAFVGREEIRAPLKTPAWEASGESTNPDPDRAGNLLKMINVLRRNLLAN